MKKNVISKLNTEITTYELDIYFRTVNTYLQDNFIKAYNFIFYAHCLQCFFLLINTVYLNQTCLCLSYTTVINAMLGRGINASIIIMYTISNDDMHVKARIITKCNGMSLYMYLVSCKYIMLLVNDIIISSCTMVHTHLSLLLSRHFCYLNVYKKTYLADIAHMIWACDHSNALLHSFNIYKWL